MGFCTPCDIKRICIKCNILSHYAIIDYDFNMSIPVIQKGPPQNPLLNVIRHSKTNFILILNKTGLIELSISPEFRTYDSEKSTYSPFLRIKCLNSSPIKGQKSQAMRSLEIFFNE
ncbi:unnamed protein product [Photorhabdus laumondii subsp. laumondii TTO1]|uniref:Photorhabdus luminescens subsp. laumondii TTO1 complete genome segment 7/17 n=1 Tax=Photorhabdus laumondii subsp. laumondii (strain DSM 15139 / CIP 105565 / TT01) TaxID=243265 RepID=Q7N5H7_PHOLL|nr:unnamed protein product [Photorhabdus laumondii subsp. laumondii TTO1]